MVRKQEATRAPVIGITMGDPLGIGPEVIVRSLKECGSFGEARFVVYGSNERLTYIADQLGITPKWSRIPHDSKRLEFPIDHQIVVRDFELPESLRSSQPGATAIGGQLSRTSVERAIEDALRDEDDIKRIDAIVTGPISKEAWSLAGSRFPGHTELLAHRTRSRRHAMIFHSKKLKVALATAHVPLMDVRNILTIGKVFDPIDIGNRFCQDLGIEKPRIAVCGLNPHAGENGLIGDEDQRIIAPAIEMARNAGINAHGPFAADTIFIKAEAGEWDMVVAMYHDQGLIPVKLLGWKDAVNVTAGIPILRTSPDHGTAFDIAGRCSADPSSMIAAIRLAVDLARQSLVSKAMKD